MKASVLEILRVLTDEELKRFRKFLISPFFTQSRKVVGLFDALSVYHPEYKNQKLTFENLHKRIHKNIPYNYSTMSNLFDDLLVLAEKFLKNISLENNKFLDYSVFLDELCIRNIDKLYRKKIRKAEKENLSFRSSDGDYFLYKYYTDRNRYNSTVAKGHLRGRKTLNYEMISLDNTNQNLITFFILEVVRGNQNTFSFYEDYNNNVKSNIIHQYLVRNNFKDELKYLKKNKDFKEYRFLYELCYYLFMLFLNPKKDMYYNKYKNCYLKNEAFLNTDLRSSFFGRLLDYCIFRNNAKYTEEKSGLYKMMLENKYYKTHLYKYIDIDLWRNIIRHCIKTKQTVWMEEFINKYKNQLHPENRENLLKYGKAMLYFEKKEFEKSLNNLKNFDYDYFLFKLDIHNLHVKIYYELKHYDQAVSGIKTYKSFLNDKNIQENWKVKHNLFISFLNKLIDFKFYSKSIDISDLRNQIMESNVQDKIWLLEKADELQEYRKAK
jgi:hypothetical protein